MNHPSRTGSCAATSPRFRPLHFASAFTLVEMLTVISLILVLMALAIPAINSMKNGNEFNQAAYNIGGYLDQARAYAMANNTYVFVGIQEVDGLQDDASGQKGTGTALGYGRVVLFAAASRDGTSGYNTSNVTGTWGTSYKTNLLAISKPLVLDNLHLAATLGTGTGRMQRAAVTAPYSLGNTSANSALTFAYPVGTTYQSGKYNFQKVINFDSQGVARIQTMTNSNSLPSNGYLEIGLQPSHGNNGNSALPTPGPSNPNQAALLFDCMSGTYHIYRP